MKKFLVKAEDLTGLDVNHLDQKECEENIMYLRYFCRREENQENRQRYQEVIGQLEQRLHNLPRSFRL